MDANQPADPGTQPTDDPAEKFSTGKKRAEAGPEETIWEGGYSAKDMFGSFVLLIIVSVLSIIISAIVLPPALLVVGIVVVVLWIAQLIRVGWTKLSVGYELTNRRFTHESGVISRTTDRIEVIDIDDVTVTQGILDRMLNVGTIHITSSDRTHPDLYLHGIDEVKNIAKMMDDARQRERDRRGVYIESI